MLSIQQLDQYYDQSHTLRNINLQLTTGKCTVLMGRNGVGKTTLLQCIMGLLPMKSGILQVDGTMIHKLGAEARVAHGIGYVPQGRQIFPFLTVEENLKIGLPARRDGVTRIPDSIYELFPILKSMRNRQGGDLSGGQQQQLAIGRALVTDPRMLMLDEPTEGIQPNLVQDIGTIVSKLVSELELTVLLVEQKLPFARKVGDHFAIMDRGAIVADGTMDSLDDSLVRQHLTV